MHTEIVFQSDHYASCDQRFANQGVSEHSGPPFEVWNIPPTKQRESVFQSEQRKAGKRAGAARARADVQQLTA